MSEAFDLSKIQRELSVLKRNAFNEVAEATTRMKSDQEITRAEIGELNEKLEPLINDFDKGVSEYIIALERLEGEDNDIEIELWEGQVEMFSWKWEAFLQLKDKREVTLH